MKVCNKCKKKKPRSEFHFNIKSKDNLFSYCNDCKYDSHFESHLHCQFNMTIKQYEMILKSQNGVCAICGQPEKTKSKYGKTKQLSIDHNHRTNKIRGLLCDKCNHSLGNFNDDSKLLEKAALYLKGQLCKKNKSN